MRETLRRALRTFLQAALGYAAASLVSNAAGIVKDRDLAVALIASSVACGLAAVMNLPKKDYDDKENKDG